MNSRAFSLTKCFASFLQRPRILPGVEYLTPVSTKCFASRLQNPRIIPSVAYSTPARCDAHMNELPVPCGPWDEYYKAQQSYYTKWLVAGVTWFLFSFFLMIYTDSIFLNWAPPALPGPATESASDDDGC